jgi:hypothetical protein
MPGKGNQFSYGGITPSEISVERGIFAEKNASNPFIPILTPQL